MSAPARPPGVVVACPCGEVYELRPEFAGRLLECPACGRHLRAGPAPGAPPPAPRGDPAFDRDVFLLRQRVFAIRSQYDVWDRDGAPILWVERPTYPLRTLAAYLLAVGAALVAVAAATAAGGAVGGPAGAGLVLLGYLAAPAVFVVVSLSARPKRHVTVYRDPSRREVLLRVVQDRRLVLVNRTFTVLTAAGEGLARFRKNYLHNLLRRRWYVEGPDGRPLALAIEDSVILSLLRRLLGPFFGLLRTNFVLERADGTVVGEFNRKFTLFDRYVLDLSADPGRAFDRRLALALGVMLDTGERR